jgi:serine/threonine protein kinase/tetratricopeptide (TPR) repeat protein
MTPERWSQVNEVLHRAMQVAPEKQAAFLDSACGSDENLRREVESLLAADEQARSSFLESPPAAGLVKGVRIGDYEIQSLLGAGGMGEVYRARDLRLRRDVAIKVLPAFVSADPGRLARFEQEAMATAALNHPNILAVYQMGTYEGAPYLVSELLEGETLRDQIKGGRIGLRRAIEYAVQMARGMAAAHEKGIVHRDLKPENLFVTKDGRVKILDFGLAKLAQPQSGSEHSALTVGEETEAGVVMGTAGYMSPEQVRGEAADHRADIFAFGAILYEMLTGLRAFQKPTSAETMTAILNEEPTAISQIAPQVPLALQRVVVRCLEKNPEQRFQSASDLAFALEALSDSGALRQSAIAQMGLDSRRSKYLKLVAVAVVGLGIIAGAYIYLRRPAKLTAKDTIVLGDFANSTGDPIFDDTLKQALTTALRQSPLLNVLSESRVATTLRLMRRSPDTPLTPEISREICQRSDGKAWIGGSISGIGTEYVIGLRAVNCQSGDTLAQEQVTAASKEKVLDALGQAASRLRGELGESLPNLQKFDVSLSQATTSSLEALKAYSLGRKNAREKGSAAAIPFMEHAIELDSDFAAAYVSLGKECLNLREFGRARELFAKAFSLREHASEGEKFDIESMYYKYVTGDLQNTTRVYREWLNSYPHSSVALGNLGRAYDAMGRYEESAELNRQAQQESANVLGYTSYAWALISLNRLADARSTIQRALDEKLDSGDLHTELYTLAFLAGDKNGMSEQVAWSNRSSDAMLEMLPLQAAAQAYSGQLHKSLDLSRLTADSLQRAGQKERAAAEIMVTALREAVFGNLQEARRIVASVPPSQLGDDGDEAGALGLAIAGDLARAESLLDTMAKQYPKGTLVQLVVLPTVQARIQLSRNSPEKSIQLLHSAQPFELTDAALGSCIYPAYVRGQAFLALKDGVAAASEFQKILSHSGIVKTCETGSLAGLGLAQAYVLQSDITKAKLAYRDFLTLWKDADPDIPIFNQAKEEYAKLRER